MKRALQVLVGAVVVAALIGLGMLILDGAYDRTSPDAERKQMPLREQ